MCKETIESLMQLLKQQPSLFSTEQRAELLQLLTPLTDLNKLSSAILEWCKNYPKIEDLLAPLIKEVKKETTTRSAGGGDTPKPTPEEEERLRGGLLQIINTPPPPAKNSDNKPFKK
jgi:hypothetical protein